MKHYLPIGVALMALGSSLALAAPDSLLPDIYSNPAPAPAPAPVRPAPAPTVVAPDPTAHVEPDSRPLPGFSAAGVDIAPVVLPEGFPSIEEIEGMTSDEIDDLFGLKPKFDIPAGARRAVRRVGVIAMDEGGFPNQALAGQPASLLRGALAGMKQPIVSRWGHVLLRRALASRMDAPKGMNPVEFAALRAAALNSIGETYVARSLVQDVDSSNYDEGLVDAAYDAYVAAGDVVGLCPVARLKGGLREDPQWKLVRSICASFAGDAREASRDLDIALSREIAPKVDVLLAQRYAGAAWEGGRSVTIEWDDVSDMNHWRYSLATALGMDVPASLREDAGPWYARYDALSPAMSLAARAAGADRAGSEGILSSRAMVDLYSQIYADDGVTGDAADRAIALREAYVAGDAAARIAAMKELWGSGDTYGRYVLTAYAAARITPNEALADDAAPLIASMLTAGLDRNALRWANVVKDGSEGWALLALANPQAVNISTGDVDNYIDDDSSSGRRKAQFLVAGLAGLGRIDDGATNSFAGRLGMNLGRESAWSRMILRAARVDNPMLVSLLAGLGMQGSSWDKMTPRHLYLIVRSLNSVGLTAEARMIAAEAVARG